MKSVLRTLLKTGLCILDQADGDVRDRVASSVDEVTNRARRTYGEASQRLDRAARAIRGEDNQALGNALRIAAGIGVGIGVGLLFAPTSGQEIAAP